MTDTPTGIDAQIAAVRAECELYNHGGMLEGTPEHEAALSAALRTLKAAKAWASRMEKAVSGNEAKMAASAIALYHAIRGDRHDRPRQGRR